MKVTDRILAGVGACMAFSLLSACGGGGGASPETPEFEAYEYRDSVMHLLEAKATIINEMFREQRPLDNESAGNRIPESQPDPGAARPDRQVRYVGHEIEHPVADD